MARDTTPDEEETRKLMTGAYKDQEHEPEGFDDWGNFTAHVVHAQRREVARLRSKLSDHGIDPGGWDDPLRGGEPGTGWRPWVSWRTC